MLGLLSVLSVATAGRELRGTMEVKQTITLKQTLDAMAAAVEPFALRYMKLNEQKGTGGEIVAISQQLLSGKGPGQQLASPPSPLPEGEREEAPATRNPNHYENMTRNLVSQVNGHYTKVHIYLILEFEGKKVII